MGLYQGDKPLSSIGKTPAAYAKDAGYTGTDDNFYIALANMPDHISDSDNPHGTTASQVGAYTKNETDKLLQKKANLDESGKVPESQLPTMDYAPSTHASQHASGGADPITPAAIGAATSDHTHTPASIGAAASSHNHSASNITSGTLGVARGGTGKSSVTSGNFLVGNGTSTMTEKTPAQVLSAIGAAASGHTHTPSSIGAAPSYTYSTSGPSSLTTGKMYL